MNRPARYLFITVAALVAAFFLMNSLGSGLSSVMGASEPIRLSQGPFMDQIKAGNIKKAEWQGTEIRGKTVGGKEFVVDEPNIDTSPDNAVYKQLVEMGFDINVKKPAISQTMISLLSVLAFPLMIFVLLYFFVLRPAQTGGNQALSFGRSRAKRVGDAGPKVTFEDVAGVEEAKQELWEIVDFLKNTKRYTALGAKIPKGILLTGPPGVGKTHLARAIAGEAGVPFFHISGSDFVEMFVGVGAARVRDLFETAKAHRPSLIFVDEIDAVGRQRGAGLGGGHDEREQTLNQLLVEMDGFDPNSGVIMIAATNRPDVLDPAILRPGRFDRQIVVDIPDAKGREAILGVHARGKPLEPNINLETLAKRTPGFTGADLANMLNEGALLAARRGHAKIRQDDLEEALDRVIAGPQRKSRVLDSHEREVIAFHEAGHAIIGELLEHCDPVHKVTVLPRGMSLGSTWSLPVMDKYLVSKQELLDDITALLGGLVSEELIFNEKTTGNSNDLQRVTQIARAMVCEYGMSERLGTLALGRRSHNPFLGRDYAMDERNYSEDVAKLIDEEVRSIVEHCRSRCQDILTSNRAKLEQVVQALLEHETLDREQFLAVMNGEKLPTAVAGDDEVKTEPETAKDSDRTPTVAPPPRFEPGPA